MARHPAHRHELARLYVSGLGGLLSIWIQAQIVFDGSLGQVGDVVPIDVPNGLERLEIPENLGILNTPNLFHSFEQFNVLTGQAAVFQATSEGIQNVIARVTGHPSSIQGGLVSEIPDANLFLINPHGITFGSGASLDVQGAFYASTADYLKFEDGKEYNAFDPGSEGLSVSPPEAFGFYGPNVNPISLTDAKLENTKGGIALVGGGIEINGDGKQLGHAIHAPGHDIMLLGVKSEGELPVQYDKLANGELKPAKLGDITIGDGALIEATAPIKNASTPQANKPNGRILIRGNKFTIQSATIRNNISGSYPVSPSKNHYAMDIEMRGNVEIGTTAEIINDTAHDEGVAPGLNIGGENIKLTGGGSLIRTVNQSKSSDAKRGDVQIKARNSIDSWGTIHAENDIDSLGDGGDIFIQAPNITFNSGSRVYAENRGSGKPSIYKMEADNSVLLNSGSEIVAGSFSSGTGSDITIITDSLLIEKNSSVKAEAWEHFNTRDPKHGDGGNISVMDANEIQIHGLLSTATNTGGNAGAIILEAGTIGVSGEINSFTDSFSPVTTTVSSGKGGNVELEATVINIPGKINTSTRFGNEKGNDGGNINLVALDKIIIPRNGEINSSSIRGGNSGEIMLDAKSIELSGEITSSSTGTTFYSNHAGNITLTADELISISRHGIISTVSEKAGSPGNLKLDSISIDINGGLLATAIMSQKVGQKIEITASGPLKIGNSGAISSFIRDSEGGEDNSLLLHGHSVEIYGIIDATIEGDQLNGGTVKIRAVDEITISPQQILKGIFVSSKGGGIGGKLEIFSGGDITITEATVSAQSDSSDAGSIFLSSQNGFVILNEGQLIANAPEGNGGNVTIHNYLVKSAGSTIDVSGKLGGTQDIRRSFDFAPELLAELRTKIEGKTTTWEDLPDWKWRDPGGHTVVGRDRYGDENAKYILFRR